MEEDDARPHRQQDVTANKPAEFKKKGAGGEAEALKVRVCSGPGRGPDARLGSHRPDRLQTSLPDGL